MISITVLLRGCPPAVCRLPVHVSPQEGTKTTTTLGHRLVATQSGMILSQNKPWGMPLAAPRFPSHVCRSGTSVKCSENWDSIEVIKKWLIIQFFFHGSSHIVLFTGWDSDIDGKDIKGEKWTRVISLLFCLPHTSRSCLSLDVTTVQQNT